MDSGSSASMESSAAAAAAEAAAVECIRSAGGRGSGIASIVEKAAGCAVTVWRMDSAQQCMAVEVLAVSVAVAEQQQQQRWVGVGGACASEVGGVKGEGASQQQ